MGFRKEEIGQRPILGLGSEPEVAKVLAHVFHHMRLIGRLGLEHLDIGGQRLERRRRFLRRLLCRRPRGRLPAREKGINGRAQYSAGQK